MQHAMSRRSFVKTSCSMAAGLGWGPRGALAIEPFPRGPAARLRLSLAAYSFRRYFGGSNPGGRALDLFQFIDFCAEHGCDGTELTSYYFPKGFDDAYLVRLRRHAFLRGLAVSGTAVGNTFTMPPGPERDRQIASVREWIDHAAVLGAPHIRIFAGNVPKGGSLEEAKRQCIGAIEECAAHAARRGIFLGVENHGGIVAEAADLLDIVRAVKSPWVGINLDTGNFHSADPYADLAACAPYAVNVQVKVEVRRKGASKSEEADLARLVGILREARYQGYVALEYEAAEDPWKAVPEWLRRMQAAFAV
ncbi:MAG: sugar phosphate isomerase/epimerase [Verrucomicrobia bacterium]|nr:sugar phosphate isomerase/epimerase [Verrucomicrobiota bacterium]